MSVSDSAITPRSAREVLLNLQGTLSEKVLTLVEMAGDPLHYAERRRLRAKAEGVDLALSCVEQELREEARRETDA